MRRSASHRHIAEGAPAREAASWCRTLEGGDGGIAQDFTDFTTFFPLLVDRSSGLVSPVRDVRRRLNALSHHGIGFGLLRYLSPDPGIRRALAGLARPDCLFQYAFDVHAYVDTGRLAFEYRYRKTTHRAESVDALGNTVLDAIKRLP